MPRTLYLRCPHCEHDNDPEYRFCGMCGTPLAVAPRREAAGEPRRQSTEGETDATAIRAGGVWQKAPGQPEAPKRAEPSNPYSPGKSDDLSENTPVEAGPYKHSRNEQVYPSRRASEARDSVPLSGPSFLGLADNTVQSPSYLLEDEEPTGGRRRIFALFVVILAVGSFLLWHWKRTGDIYPWEPGRSEDHSSAAKVATPAPQGAPLGAQNQATPIDTNHPGAGSAQPNPTAADTKPANTLPPAPVPDQVPNSPNHEGEAQTIQNDDAGGQTIQEPSKAAPSTASSASSASSSGTSQPPAKSAPIASAAISAAAPAASAKNPGATASKSVSDKVSKASLRQPAPDKTQDARDKGDPLFIQGQRYLYGTGVRQNCDLAQKSLMTAAQNSNVQAQSTLATMYATGHCAPRSLPLAYRWFAKASHQAPNNPRIEKDLEILWKQMTPEEKQTAIQNR
jgi:hypothetical protein